MAETVTYLDYEFRYANGQVSAITVKAGTFTTTQTPDVYTIEAKHSDELSERLVVERRHLNDTRCVTRVERTDEFTAELAELQKAR